MAHDGFSLDDKRVPVAENDIPDVVNCWGKRFDKSFNDSRYSRIEELQKVLAPMKAERLKLQAELNRLQFESVIDTRYSNVETRTSNTELSNIQSRLANIESQISLPQAELDRLTRQFWVTKEQVKANKYDLSASRYRQADADAAYHEKPAVTLERLKRLEQVMLDEINALRDLLK